MYVMGSENHKKIILGWRCKEQGIKIKIKGKDTTNVIQQKVGSH